MRYAHGRCLPGAGEAAMRATLAGAAGNLDTVARGGRRPGALDELVAVGALEEEEMPLGGRPTVDRRGGDRGRSRCLRELGLVLRAQLRKLGVATRAQRGERRLALGKRSLCLLAVAASRAATISGIFVSRAASSAFVARSCASASS